MAVVRIDVPPRPAAPQWVDASPFRAHLSLLMAAGGLSPAEIALLAGLPVRVVAHLGGGRAGRSVRRVNPHVARRLLRLTVEEVRAIGFRAVPVATTACRVRRLLAEGRTAAEVAGLLRTIQGEVEDIAEERASVCSQLVALRAAAAVDRGAAGFEVGSAVVTAA